MTLRLHGFWRSSATWRVRIALAYKGLAYTYVPVHLRRDGGEQHRPEFRAKSPIGHVPVLELVIDGVERRVVESIAIMELLDELFPTPALLPADRWKRTQARQIALLIASGIQPLQNTSVQLHVENVLHADGGAWVKHWVERGLAAVEALARESAGTFAVGDAVSIADACIVPQLAFARRFGLDLAPYPTLVALDERCAALPAFVAAHAEHQPDAEP